MAEFHILRIHELEILVSLGCLPEERKTQQPVRLNLDVKFEEKPQACETDLLEDSLCYDEIGRRIVSLTQNREFKLIEYLAQEILNSLHEMPSRSNLNLQFNLRVHKLHPPVDWKNEGTSFEIREF